MSTCRAERERLDGGMKRCRKRRWGGTDYCYQHAISTGNALVVTMETLRWAFDTDRDADPQSARLARMLWNRLRTMRV